MDVKALMLEKKKSMLDRHTKKQDNERSNAIVKSIKNFSQSLPHNASMSFALILCLKCLFGEMVQSLARNIFRIIGEWRLKTTVCY